jgi:hypothetical protein
VSRINGLGDWEIPERETAGGFRTQPLSPFQARSTPEVVALETRST